jgi:hypothetical protein
MGLCRGVTLREKVHQDQLRAISFTNLVDVRDVRMIERGRRLRFLNQTAHATMVGSEFTGQNF